MQRQAPLSRIEAAEAGTLKKKLPQPHPHAVRQPDGSLAIAVHKNYVEEAPPETPKSLRHLVRSSPRRPQPSDEQKAILLILVLGVLLECLGTILHAIHAAKVHAAVTRAYPYRTWLHPADPMVLLCLCWGELVYASLFYACGLRALFVAQRRAYETFAQVALVGVFIQPFLLAVAGELSAVLLFHRLLAHGVANACILHPGVPLGRHILCHRRQRT
mmetsp:Transcript_8177/g.18279  ORF Transcript_8177/g.18279 Transcript_8177/m.18279 type:complete len:217 (-) Transcript_8177:56-706(-)